jgi:2-polyprenyl-3-methyl-5-hydroxy-6-metoxy-1,4-benzoquinol methylase
MNAARPARIVVRQMINQIHALWHRPAAGWDPVPPAHAAEYAAHEWSHHDDALIDRVEGWLGGLAGKRVLDLGGGPGHCAVAFARRGADVTWHDVSRTYEQIARRRAAAAGVTVRFSLGYLEEARRLAERPFDLVFNRICWNYCMDDRAFSALVYDLVRPGGGAYVDTHTAEFAEGGGWRHLAARLYAATSIKVGHPHPPRGRTAALFQRFSVDRVILDYSTPGNERIFFSRPPEPR